MGTSLKKLTVCGKGRHTFHMCAGGELGQKFSGGESLAVGCQQGLSEELDLDLSLDPLHFDREKSEGAEKTPWTHPAGPGNCVIKVLRETAQGWEVSQHQTPRLTRHRKLCRCPGARGSGRGTGREINAGTVAALWGEAGMAPGVIPAISQVRRYEGKVHFSGKLKDHLSELLSIILFPPPTDPYNVL